jgi:hypothetical protein
VERGRRSRIERTVQRAENTMTRILHVLLLLLCIPIALDAQTQCTATNTSCSNAVGSLQITITIANTFEMSLSNATTALSTPTTSTYNAGFAEDAGPTATIRSNAPWTLSISALTPTWSAVNTEIEPARVNKPASDLAWGLSSLGPFTDLTTNPVQVGSGPRTLAATISLFYRTRYQWDLDTPGIYSLPVVFTIVAP